ncbi:hypothetical protein FUAX_06130 [Fulvitalea axinellae]|uniref:2'-5' RNA ligase n=1 Tax=Fulvitalea axinellae TaxID=1182444 RepID=A0AAU9C7X0_9BACT|nr:hypothetical protein FUAX_06130 [Fulvitalea axinellae]
MTEKRKDDNALYFVALIPGTPVREEVWALKEEIAERYQSKGALRSPAHITLHMPFKWREKKLETLTKTLGDVAGRTRNFSIQLTGFDFFEPRVIFVNVEKNEALNELQYDVAKAMRTNLNLLNADYKQRGFHPHMTIGFRDLKKAKFHEAKPAYQGREYERVFEADKLCLLKHNGERWEEFAEFPFRK